MKPGSKDFKKGMFVTRLTPYSSERGRVKSVTKEWVFVVYKCNEEWDTYTEYTANATDRKELVLGWASHDIL